MQQSRKKKFLIALGIIGLVLALLLGGGYIALRRWAMYDNAYLYGATPEVFQRFLRQGKDEIPDKSNENNYANPNINQAMARAEGWKQIVQDSQFPFGEFVRGPSIDYYANPMRQVGSAYPVIDGSTVMIPLAIECVRQHWGTTNVENEVNIVRFSTTHDAYEKLFGRQTANWFWYVPPEWENSIIYDTNSMSGPHYDEFSRRAYRVTPERPVELFLGTAPSPEELAMAAEYGVTPVIKPICWDAFVFITHVDNPVESLTLEQARGIFSGEITNWKQVGGRDEGIQAYQREPGSGSQTGMEDLVMRGAPMADPQTVLIVEGMAGLVERVAEYRNGKSSIGYTYRYYIDRLYKNDKVKTVAIESIAPTDENIQNGTYPLSVNYVGVIRAGDEDEPGGLFLDWILSDEGQACVAQAGYIPMNN